MKWKKQRQYSINLGGSEQHAYANYTAQYNLQRGSVLNLIYSNMLELAASQLTQKASLNWNVILVLVKNPLGYEGGQATARCEWNRSWHIQETSLQTATGAHLLIWFKWGRAATYQQQPKLGLCSCELTAGTCGGTCNNGILEQTSSKSHNKLFHNYRSTSVNSHVLFVKMFYTDG